MFLTRYFRKCMDWWLQGLSYFCPKSCKRAMGLLSDQITVEADSEQIILTLYSAESGIPVDTRQFKKEAEDARISALQWLQAQHQAKIILIIPETLLLRKSFLFPQAAQSNLREALSFEVNRRTPFNTDQAYFDYLVIGSDEAANKLQIELVVAPKQSIKPLLELLQAWGIRLDALKPLLEYQKNTVLNLLADEYKNHSNQDTDILTLSLVSVAFFLFLTMLYLPIMQQTKQLEVLGNEMRANKKTTLQLQQLQEKKQNLIDQINFLENKHKHTPTAVGLLNEITTIIPDDTWLNQLIIKNGELQLQGESSNASSLIQIIESSKSFSQARFRSPLTKNNVNGKDRFHLSANLMTVLNVKEEL